MSTRLTLTPLRCHNPRKNRGIPTISAGHLDGGTANVSTVDTELLRCSTPRGLPRSWCRRAPPPGDGLTFRRLTPARPFLVPAPPQGGGSTTVPALQPRAGTLHEGGDLLAEGCAHCTNPRPLWSRPNPPPVAPDPRAVGVLARARKDYQPVSPVLARRWLAKPQESDAHAPRRPNRS